MLISNNILEYLRAKLDRLETEAAKLKGLIEQQEALQEENDGLREKLREKDRSIKGLEAMAKHLNIRGKS